MQGPELVLRDVHVPPAPPLWPPAPGWWLVLLVVLALSVLVWWLRRRRRLRLQSWEQLFDAACARPSLPAQVAGISELLRRAARRVEPDADRLQGQQWIDFLDGRRPGEFNDHLAALLLEGGYRRDLDPEMVESLRQVARRRFLEMMAAAKR